MITLQRLNALPEADFVAALASIFEHSPWVVEHIAGARPFANSIVMHAAMCAAVMQADEAQQLALIREHPELAGRAAIRGGLTAASISEQRSAGLSACTPLEYRRLQTLNSAYNGRFGFPFILAVKGHTPASVIAVLERRVTHAPEEERRIALQEICRIARFRIADLVLEDMGEQIMAMMEELARYSETPGGLTCSYLTPAHQATAERIHEFMLVAGLAVHRDAIGNVVGVLPGDGRTSMRLLTGSHYDTVINAGKYDGRLGIALPIAVAGRMRRAGLQLPFPLEIIAFAEEEGVRFKSTFLGSRAVAGKFDPALLDSTDAQGIALRDAIGAAGSDVAAIASIARDPAHVLCFVEVHIEQGPVLLAANKPLGVVTGIAGSVRSTLTVEGLSGHAGTVPMDLRHDAAVAAAEIVLAVEGRCSREPGLIGTVGILEVPDGAVNVIPGRCRLSIDIRAGTDALRDAADSDLSLEIQAIALRRGVAIEQRRVLQAPGVACAQALQEAWAASALRTTGAPAPRLPSGAGHDAMMMANLTPIGMLFVRCGNGGISHHPSEALAAADAAIAAAAFEDFVTHFEVPE